ncbi:MAG: hypothetical protein GY862_03625 [Gammaproteobacteria bacterium]|nr:hypothetical protein [Gammaproteobacteria bacterium]
MAGSSYPNTRWHQILGGILKEWLTPAGILVQHDAPIGVELPRADILLLKSARGKMRHKQRQRLADGLRDCRANHLVLEFKYTESLNEDALTQLLCYEWLYRKSLELKKGQTAAFLLCSKTPRPKTLRKFGYQQTKRRGVYQSGQALISRATLLVLNELSDEPHNAPLKCFASRQTEMRKAYRIIRENRLPGLTLQLERMFNGLYTLLFGKVKGEEMKARTKKVDELTMEYVVETGQAWMDHMLSLIPLEDRIKGLDPEELLKAVKPEERVKGLDPAELLKAVKPEERVKGLDPEDLLKAFKPEDLLKAFKPEDLLKAVKPEDLLKAVKPEDLLKAVKPEELFKGLSSKELKSLKRKLNKL